MGMVGLGLAVLVGCTSSDEPTEASTDVGATSSQSPSIAPVAGESLSPQPSPVVATAVLADVDGRWCPTSPPEWGDVECIDIKLPVVVRHGDYDPSNPEYVYPWDSAGVSDPKTFTDATYGFPPNLGDCWSAAVDGYPPMSGAAFLYCPAHAVSGESWIDDPANSPDIVGESGDEVPDFRGEDRLYISQDMNPYPYVRASA